MHTRSGEVPGRAARACAWGAATLGVASGAVSALWAAGVPFLLETIGGELERWGHERSVVSVILLVAIALLKAGVGMAAPLATGAIAGAPVWTRSRAPRLLSKIAAIVLVVYGGFLTIGGFVVLALIGDNPDGADRVAMRWHAFFWDPWFLLWGILFLIALARSRPPRGGRRGPGPLR